MWVGVGGGGWVWVGVGGCEWVWVGVGGCAWVWVYRRTSCAYDYVYDHECVCFIKLMNDQSMVI